MFTPQTFDGVAAAHRMLDRGTAPYRSCLETVATAIKGNLNSDSPGSYGNAIDGWNRCPVDRRHGYGDGYTAPPGAVGYATSPSGAGHVWIHLTATEVVSTDTPTNGRIGRTTVDELRRRMKLGILGWTDWFLGHNITLAGTTGDGYTLIEEEESTMQPQPTRVIRSNPKAGGSGDIAMLYLAGVEIIGGTLMPDIPSANGQAFMAGQPVNDGSVDPESKGYYWIDLSGEEFGWQLARHQQLVDAYFARLATVTPATIDYDALVKALKVAGAFNLTIAGTARPAQVGK